MADLKYPSDLRYAKTDEWVRLEGNEAVIGVTDYAQYKLSDIVFVELPEQGKTLNAEDTFGTVESVKSASDLVMPVAGTIVAVNNALEDTPDTINSDPYGGAWLVRIKMANTVDANALMDAAAYKKYCDEREGM